MTFFTELETDEQFENLTKKNDVCVVDFYADWCKPCKMLKSELDKKISEDEKLSKCIGESVVFLKVNVEKFEDLASTFHVASIPHVVFYHKGELCKNIIRGTKPSEIIEFVHNLLNL